MRRGRPIQIIVSLCLISLLVFPALARPGKVQRIKTGMWGGDHIRLEVSANSATIEYDCAQGTIAGPFTIDSHGNFCLKGTHMPEHGGPVRRDEEPNSKPAAYTGWTDGKKMTLKVVLEGSGDEIGTFHLNQGEQGRVWKCK